MELLIGAGVLAGLAGGWWWYRDRGSGGMGLSGDEVGARDGAGTGGSAPSLYVPKGEGVGDRRPTVGDRVWWAPKQIGAVITEAFADGSFVFQGGPIVRNAKDREGPRWTVSSSYTTRRQVREFSEERGVEFEEVWKRATHWRSDLGMWVVGHGPMPKRARDRVVMPDGRVVDAGHQVLTPDPVRMSGQAKGSFAVKTGR